MYLLSWHYWHCNLWTLQRPSIICSFVPYYRTWFIETWIYIRLYRSLRFSHHLSTHQPLYPSSSNYKSQYTIHSLIPSINLALTGLMRGFFIKQHHKQIESDIQNIYFFNTNKLPLLKLVIFSRAVLSPPVFKLHISVSNNLL